MRLKIHLLSMSSFVCLFIQNKDTTESRSRGVNNTSSRWGKVGTDRYDGRAGSTQYGYSGMWRNCKLNLGSFCGLVEDLF